ncbi:RNA-binding protein [Massilia solisilvae]|uniref:RNA-binding protein n=1 Tax=Massilia solisilvae TaxID=1811225 RepID=A0ABT2BFP3_9BURK|nr:RNA-binding protein [Massilia solisilvae]MCS0607333.1 RNA-binding protein [Massilia solisilvae]
MAQLWLGNVDDSATDDDIRDLLVRYGFPAFDAIEHVPGSGARPAVMLTFNEAPPQELRTLGDRIQNLFWKNRKINVQVM